LILFRLSWRGFKAPLYWQRWSERFGNVTPHAGDNPVIWIHAVSVGETEATRPLVNALMQHYPNYTILITTMTPTGSERVKSLYGSTVEHCYLPYDVPFMVKRFFQRKAPKFGIIMETEIWPNLLYTANHLAIPLVLANARLSEKSADGYLRFEQFIKDTLANLTVIAAQSERDRQQFKRLGADIKKVHAIGNLKYEITLASGIQEQAALMRDMWNVNRPVFIAASTHEGEEEFILNAYRAIRAKHPDLLLILVPRHPERFDRVTALVQRAGFTTLRRSERKPCHSQIEVLMVDTMGELPLFYACSDVAFVGGSLMPVGGHNILEPAALGVPIISGPHVFNFSEITQQFIDANAMVMVQDTAALIEQVSRLLGFPTERDEMGKAAKTLIKSSQGASARLVNLINYNILQHEK
jgi:3-deoxy-D-manno-octulosonic-acid transferase